MRLAVSTAINTVGFPVAVGPGEFVRLRYNSGSSCADASRGAINRPNRARPNSPLRIMCVVMADVPALERKHRSSERLSRGLHRGLARAAVLLVLTALARVSAFHFARIRASDRRFDHAPHTSGSILSLIHISE